MVSVDGADAATSEECVDPAPSTTSDSCLPDALHELRMPHTVEGLLESNSYKCLLLFRRCINSSAIQIWFYADQLSVKPLRNVLRKAGKEKGNGRK